MTIDFVEEMRGLAPSIVLARDTAIRSSMNPAMSCSESDRIFPVRHARVPANDDVRLSSSEPASISRVTMFRVFPTLACNSWRGTLRIKVLGSEQNAAEYGSKGSISVI